MTTTKYETGATSHAVNDLILFTDNTRELAHLRDQIYKRALTPGDIVFATFKVNGTNSGLHSLANAFSGLLRAAIKQYKKELPSSSDHLSEIKHWDEQGQEFCQLYANDFNTWKAEHGY
jgi:hypothetical protein